MEIEEIQKVIDKHAFMIHEWYKCWKIDGMGTDNNWEAWSEIGDVIRKYDIHFCLITCLGDKVTHYGLKTKYMIYINDMDNLNK